MDKMTTYVLKTLENAVKSAEDELPNSWEFNPIKEFLNTSSDSPDIGIKRKEAEERIALIKIGIEKAKTRLNTLSCTMRRSKETSNSYWED